MTIYLQPTPIESEEAFYEADGWYGGIPSEEVVSTSFTVVQTGIIISFDTGIPSEETFNVPWIVEPFDRSYITFKASPRTYKYQAKKKK